MKKLIPFLFIFSLIFGISCTKPLQESDTISAENLLKQISEGKKLVIKNKTITGVLDFTKILDKDNNLPVSTIYIESELAFVNCTFEDSVLAYSFKNSILRTVFNKAVMFYECKFLKNVQFSQTEFSKDVSFELSVVEGQAEFNGTDFSKGAIFAAANFMNDTKFLGCRFGGRTSFFKTMFKKSVLVQRAKFYEPVLFWDSHFYGYFEFSDNMCYDLPDFSNANFSDRVVFCNSVYYWGLKLSGSKVSNPESVEQHGNYFVQSTEVKDIFNQ